MLSNTISNYTVHHIKSSNIIKWLRVIKTKREKEKVSQKGIPTDWESERKKRKRELEFETKWRYQKSEKKKKKNNNLSEICM